MFNSFFMKYIFALVFSFVLIPGVFAQSFEGRIIYTSSYISKEVAITNDQTALMMGNKHEFYIKENNYKLVSNGTSFKWQLYTGSDNKLYRKWHYSKSILWIFASMNEDELVKTETNKEVVDILGYKCDELIITTAKTIQKYYYNSKFGIYAQFFVGHKYGNWYDFVSRAKAIPLKIIIEDEFYFQESVASEIKEEKLDQTLFKLPSNVKTEMYKKEKFQDL